MPVKNVTIVALNCSFHYVTEQRFERRNKIRFMVKRRLITSKYRAFYIIDRHYFELFFAIFSSNRRAASGALKMNSPRHECSMCGGTQYELKCLPCSHSVCTYCIQIENRAQTSVQCPIDEHEYPLTDNGIDSLPTKGFLVEVSSNNCYQDQSPITEMQALLTFTQEYKNDLATAIRDMEHAIHSSLSLQESAVKQEIRNTAEKLVECVLGKEQELYKEVDSVIEAEKREKQQELADFSLQAHHIIQVVQRHQSQFKRGTENASLLNQLQGELAEVNERKNALMEKNQDSSTVISFVVNEACFEEPIGKVAFRRDDKTGNGRLNPSKTRQRIPSNGEKKKKLGHVITTIAPPSPLTEKFRPWALSVSESGHIAVVDRGNNCIHIFNPRGEFLRHVAKPYGRQSSALEVYGVTFISRNTFAVAEYSPSTGSGCLLEMAISGEHLRVIANLKGPAYVTSFDSTSSRSKKIVAVYYTNSLEAPEVLGDEKLPFGSDKNSGLFHPQKGVFLKDKLIFSDSNEVQNQGSVKIFEADGKFSHEFGKQPLWSEGCLGHPLRIAADPLSCVVLVYQQSPSKIRGYDVTGACVSEFDTVSGLLDFTVTPDGRLIATCSKNSEFPNSVIIISYIERQKS